MTPVIGTTHLIGTTHRALNAAALKELAAKKGPCLSIFVPDHHPGAQAGSRTPLVRDLIASAQKSLEANRKLRAQGAFLLAPLAQIAEDAETVKGGPGFVIFRSHDYLEIFAAPGIVAPGIAAGAVTVASHFTLLPLLERVYAPADFYILGLSRKYPRFLRYRQGICEELPLPASVPATLEEAGGFDQPDHDLENRSTAGVGLGAMKAVHFGTLTDREAAGEYLYHYCGLIDRGLKDTLNGSWLLLAGVHEEAAAYRRAAKYDKILAAEIVGNIDDLPLEKIAAQAAGAAREHYYKAGEAVLAEYREMPDRARTLSDTKQILRAAAAGRVHQLCVRENTQMQGHMERELDTITAAHEDVANAAVVETIRHGGEVFVLAEDKLPALEPLAAILRF